MIAFVSDIHANEEAFRAVLADIDGRDGIEEIICLGDIVGYGPDPEVCLDLVMERCSVTIQGNHDWAVFHDAIRFNPIAKQVIDCIRERLRPKHYNMLRKKERWEFMKNLPEKENRNYLLFVHGSPRSPTFEYILPDDIFFERREKMKEIFDLVPQICFVGHSHVPGIWTEDFQFFSPKDIDYEYTIGDQKIVINDGSVGQPRDRDNRASWVEFGDGKVIFHRVPYDYAVTQEKIRAIACIDNKCAERLAVGR